MMSYYIKCHGCMTLAREYKRKPAEALFDYHRIICGPVQFLRLFGLKGGFMAAEEIMIAENSGWRVVGTEDEI